MVETRLVASTGFILATGTLTRDRLKFHLKFLGNTIERKSHNSTNGLTVCSVISLF